MSVPLTVGTREVSSSGAEGGPGGFQGRRERREERRGAVRKINELKRMCCIKGENKSASTVHSYVMRQSKKFSNKKHNRTTLNYIPTLFSRAMLNFFKVFSI